MADYQLLINGELTDAAAGETFATYNPAKGEKIADVAKAGKEALDKPLPSVAEVDADAEVITGTVAIPTRRPAHKG